MSNQKIFIDQTNTSQILLGLDFGDKTIGIAISDRTKTIASPMITLKRKGIKQDVIELINLCNEHNVGGIVFGLPLSLSGEENERTRKVRKFADEILDKIDIFITFHDERYSSDVVYKELRRNSISISKIKKRLITLRQAIFCRVF